MATHEAIVPEPPKVTITYYDSGKGHVAVARADSVEHALDGRAGTLLQGAEKTPMPVFEGDAIVEYEDQSHIYAVLRPGDVSAWFRPIVTGSEKALPKKSSAKTAAEE